MGKGDKKTKRGKIIMGTFGVRRPRKKRVPIVVATKAKPKTVTKAKSNPAAKPKAAPKPKAATKPKAASKAKPKAEAKK
jgi:30S ribosomal protein S31